MGQRHWCVCVLTINAEARVLSLAVLTDGKICSGLMNGSIKLLNAITGVCEMAMNGHTGYVRKFLFGACDSILYSCSMNGTIKVWNTSTGVCERTLEGHSDDVTDMVLLKDGRLCSGSLDGIIKVWDTSSGVCERTMDHGDKTKGFIGLTLLHDDRLLSNFKRQLYLWN
jgi:WD40 repeat protein